MTEYHLGKREQMSWAEESTYGTAVTPTEIVGKNVRIEPNLSHDWVEILAAGSDSRDIETREKGPRSVSFTLTFAPTSWKFLKYTTHGSVNTTDEGSYYSHTLTLSDDVNSFTVEWAKRGSTNQVTTFKGCVVRSITLNYNSTTGEGGEGLIEVSMDILAQDFDKGTSVTSLSAPTKNAFQFRHVKLTYEGTETKEVKSGSLTLANSITEDDSRYCNTTLDQTIGEPIPKTSRYSFDHTINQKDNTFFNDWASETKLTGTNKLEFIRGTNDKAIFTFGDITMDSTNSPTNLEGVDTVSLVGVSHSLSIETQDDISSY